ncbi:MAG: hypothetical protein AABX10_01915 [Nanoarchaeota archaeon]
MKRSHIWIIIFNVIYLVAFFIYYISINNYEFLWYIFVIIILGSFIGLNLHKVKFDNLVLWLLSIWGFLHMLAGGLRINGTTLYSLRLIDIIDKGDQFYVLKMDQLIHLYGFFVSAVLVYQLIRAIGGDISKSPKLMVFLAWIGSMGLGALNEMVEFVAFVSFAHTGVGDFYNINLDLIFNAVGALVGALLANKIYKKD